MASLAPRIYGSHLVILLLIVSFMLSSGVMEGADNPESKVVLLGADHRKHSKTFATNVDAIQATECFEYIQRLQNSQFLLPHFQAYKIIYAYILLDYGFTDEAYKCAY